MASPGAGGIRSVEVSPDGQLAISTSMTSKLAVYSMQTTSCLYTHDIAYDKTVFPPDHEFLNEPTISYTGKFFHT
jgi:hypothetical protein